jgi:hypothetical protein
MPRPKTELSLVKKVAQAFRAVSKVKRAGRNTTRHYPFTKASDVLEAVRDKLLSQDVLIHIDEGQPEYVSVAMSNGGEQITECRLPVTYTFMDEKSELKPMRFNGIGRDVEDKSLAKAQTGAQKSLLKRFGLMVEDADEFDGDFNQAAHDGHDVHDAKPTTNSQKPVTFPQIRAFNDACASSGKTSDEIMRYLFEVHHVTGVKGLTRGKQFTAAIAWAGSASNGACSPKPQAAPALQGKLPMTTPAPPFEMRVGGKTEMVQPKTGSYSV